MESDDIAQQVRFIAIEQICFNKEISYAIFGIEVFQKAEFTQKIHRCRISSQACCAAMDAMDADR